MIVTMFCLQTQNLKNELTCAIIKFQPSVVISLTSLWLPMFYHTTSYQTRLYQIQLNGFCNVKLTTNSSLITITNLWDCRNLQPNVTSRCYCDISYGFHFEQISTNGLVSFDGELKEYTGELFPLGREVIAPFYADVDIRTTGEVFFRYGFS